MSAKHTPGPWHVWADVDVYASNKYVGTVRSPGGCSTAEDRDNARLIAAAPALLDALRGLVALAEPGVTASNPCWPVAGPAFDAARAAIALAEGGAQ